MVHTNTKAELLGKAVQIDVAGLSLEMLRAGRGHPLVFLHGMDGLEGSLDLIGQLSTAFEVFAPSMPGFGASELPPSFDTIDDLAYLHLDLMQKLNLNDAILVGVSFGGWVAAEALIKNQIGVSKLILGAPLGLRTADRREQGMADIFMIPERDADQLLQLAPHPGTNLGDIDEHSARRIVRNREAVSLFGWSPYLNNPKLQERLHRIGVPTLVAWGAQDRLVSELQMQAFARAIPNARLEKLIECGHRIYVDQPQRLAQLISNFSIAANPMEAPHARMAI